MRGGVGRGRGNGGREWTFGIARVFVGIHPGFYLSIPYKLTRPFFYNSLRARCRVIDCSPLSPSLSTQKRFRPAASSIHRFIHGIGEVSISQPGHQSILCLVHAYISPCTQTKKTVHKQVQSAQNERNRKQQSQPSLYRHGMTRHRGDA